MNHISEITTGMIITVGTVIGLPITGWFTLSNFKEKKYVAAAAGALSFVALAAYTLRFFGTPQERLSAESATSERGLGRSGVSGYITFDGKIMKCMRCQSAARQAYGSENDPYFSCGREECRINKSGYESPLEVRAESAEEDTDFMVQCEGCGWIVPSYASCECVEMKAESFRASGPTHKYMNKKKVDQLLQANGGKIFNATFIKRDGSKRTMTCRGGVKKYVKGVGMRYNPKAYDLRVVFDLDKMQYRMIPIDRVISLRIGGTTYKAS